jgi:hypothetical protein
VALCLRVIQAMTQMGVIASNAKKLFNQEISIKVTVD